MTSHRRAIPLQSKATYLLAALLPLAAGCTSADVIAQSARPGMFRLYSCNELNTKGSELLVRERELKDLMQKAEQGPGGQLAVAIAYTNEYNRVLGELRELDNTAADKKCAIKYRSASDRAVR